MIPGADCTRTVRAARVAVQSARLRPPAACEACGSTGSGVLQGHHDDYRRPLDLRWLCRSCHIKFHVALRKAAGTYKPGGRRPAPKKRKA